MGNKGQNVLQLQSGLQLKIIVEHDGGFITSIEMIGPAFVQPPDKQEDLQRTLKWVQLNPVALFTRIRFFMLKYKVMLVGIDCNELAKAIAECIRHPISA